MKTQPRPVQAELPVWLTTAGNPESYREAAALGANVLTHLLGQSIEELKGKIAIYRQALKDHGRDPAAYKVTLLLHTLLGDDREEVRALARGPMKDYLRSAASLIKQYAWSFPAFKKPQGVSQPAEIDLQSLRPEELDEILEFAFLRYFEDSGLFGTVEDALARLREVKAAGVDEIGCLIDFGVPVDLVLERLDVLARVTRLCRSDAATDHGFARQVLDHQVTHLQCTPSMARMFMMVDEDRAALGEISHLFLGGEALPGSLLAALRTASGATVENMYGPTETTIWSSTFTATASRATIPIGRPIANTQLYVLDAHLRPVPIGEAGELYIGGAGVARGYLNRERLTQERFLPNPFAEGRIYRTGDLARFDADGVLHFLGRGDDQVKIRGYRIELGEIESRIAAYPGIRQAVVKAFKEPSDTYLAAYIRTDGAPIDEADLRAHLSRALPDAMLPRHVVLVEKFPLTPNAKIDRNALPPPASERSSAARQIVAPDNDVQRAVGEVFKKALNLEQISIDDNFFALGGHSLLAVQVQRELKSSIAPALSITDLFRFPTARLLAEHITGADAGGDRLDAVADRAAARRNAMDLRRQRVMRPEPTA